MTLNCKYITFILFLNIFFDTLICIISIVALLHSFYFYTTIILLIEFLQYYIIYFNFNYFYFLNYNTTLIV